MTILDVLLNDYLSKEEVQQLARDRGLPTGRSKGDLIDLLLSRNLNPTEPLAFLNVTALRDLCREFGLDRSGGRDNLTERLLGAIRAESPSWIDGIQLVRSPLSSGMPPEDGKPSHHGESAGPWTVAGVVATAILSVVLILGVSAFGIVWGSGISVAVAIALAVILLKTSHRWHPRVASFMRRAGP